MTMMLRALRWLAYLTLASVLAVGLFLFGIRFADGPAGIVAGGAFTTGELHQGTEPDWRFLKDRGEVEFQLLSPARSRTTWILEHEGRIYIPCGYMDTAWGRIWKRWPIEAEADGRALLRIDGTLHKRMLVRIRTGPQVPHLLNELARKYFAASGTPEQRASAQAVMAQQVQDQSLWLFELTSRENGA
jgi:hypothetical protein